MRCFKSYDVRGVVGDGFGPAEIAAIGAALVALLGAGRVVIGRDIRPSSPALSEALTVALAGQGAEVVDLGLCGTEEVYHATARMDAGAGVMVTASHNPADQNGMKIVGPGARPLSGEEFARLRGLCDVPPAARPAPAERRAAPEMRADYVATLLGLVDVAVLPELTVLVNAGNGTAGPTFDALAMELEKRGAKTRFARLHHDPDPAFPNGVPNPMLPENRPATSAAVQARGAAMGVAWDGDFDRCFLFDETGGFVPGEIVTMLLAQAFLARAPGETVVHDSRVVLGVRDAIEAAGGRAVMSATGHSWMKATMRREGAIYGGELSAHHYFRDFHFCDSGMLPWLLALEALGRGGQPLSVVTRDWARRYPSSGEVNLAPRDVEAAFAAVEAAYLPRARAEDRTDGLSLEFKGWRFSLRRSHTEALVRLNVEASVPAGGDAALVAREVAAIRALVTGS